MKIFQTVLIIILFGISTTFADYQRNIDDEIKIHEFKVKLERYLETVQNSEEIKEKYRKLISEKLGKNHDELKGFWPKGYDEYKSFREYFLMNIYSEFITIDKNNFTYKREYTELKILENDYVRTIARDKNLYIDNDGIYSEYPERLKSYHLSFIQIEKNITLLDYLEEKILDSDFRSNCDIVENTSSHMMYGDKTGLYFKANAEFEKVVEPQGFYKCGEYGYGVFTRMSDTLVFFKPFPIEYVGLDFSLIEIK